MIYTGDCLHVLADLAKNSIDTCITDPPYGLQWLKQDDVRALLRAWLADEVAEQSGGGFMNAEWDAGVPGPRYWRAVGRVLKPGATLLAFGGTRTFDLLAIALRLAGFEIRDTIMWAYGSGFPKSYNISKGIDKQTWVTCPECDGRNSTCHFCAGKGRVKGAKRKTIGHKRGVAVADADNQFGGINRGAVGVKQTAIDVPITAPATDSAALWDGWGTGLKPAWEPIIVAQKPRDGTFVNNALTWGVAGLHIDACRVGNETMTSGGSIPDIRANNYENSTGKPRLQTEVIEKQGRWPANLIHDGSAEVAGVFPHTKNGNNEDSAARFFYCAKSSSSERDAGCEHLYWQRDAEAAGGWRSVQKTEWEELAAHQRKQGNIHPTVKPLALLRYLARLTATPTGGAILDPFAGSGTTGVAAVLENREFVGVEIHAAYADIARARMSQAVQTAQSKPSNRK